VNFITIATHLATHHPAPCHLAATCEVNENAGVAAKAHERKKLGRLYRYIARATEFEKDYRCPAG